MTRELFVDTSVLLNYVQVWLEGDEGSVAIIEGDYENTVCPPVDNELETRCKTRRQIYIDLQKFVKQEEEGDDELHPIFNYEVVEFESRNPSVPVTNNDRSHLRELQIEFASIDDEDKFYELRKFIRSVRARKRTVDSEITNFDEGYEHDLVNEIDSRINHRQDSLVLAHGAAWRDFNGADNDTVVTLDYEDMINKESEINSAIEMFYTSNHHLNIISPNAV